MLQVILVKPGKVEFREVPLPQPSEGEVVVKINTALTCGTDLKAYIRGHILISMPGPFGHEFSGTVVMVGKNVKGFKEGDHIMGVHSAPCMECRYCRRGLYNLCEVIMERKALGAFSEYILLPSHVVKHNLYHKPQNLSFEEAALLEPFSCVVHPYSKIRLDEVESALIIGAGPIGLMHLAYLNKKNIKTLIADFSEERLSVASKMGAVQTIFPDDVENVVKEVTNNLGVDLVIECTGQLNVWEKAPDYVRRGGTVILFGGCPAGTKVSYDTHRLHYDELNLLGSFHYTPQDVKTAYQILTRGDVNLSLLISGEFPLKAIEDAFTLLKEGKGIKYALKP
jgi:L-iditol 2-dehydrogenase